MSWQQPGLSEDFYEALLAKHSIGYLTVPVLEAGDKRWPCKFLNISITLALGFLSFNFSIQ